MKPSTILLAPLAAVATAQLHNANGQYAPRAENGVVGHNEFLPRHVATGGHELKATHAGVKAATATRSKHPEEATHKPKHGPASHKPQATGGSPTKNKATGSAPKQPKATGAPGGADPGSGSGSKNKATATSGAGKPTSTPPASGGGTVTTNGASTVGMGSVKSGLVAVAGVALGFAWLL